MKAILMAVFIGVFYSCSFQNNSTSKDDLEIIPLSTADPLKNISELEKLDVFISDRKIVAMGEATHGTREFFQMKHRMFRYLVEEKGYRVFLMEATFGECQLVNDYLQSGTGTALDALKAMEGNGWQTIEVLEMLKWMRTFNKDRSGNDNIRFYGFDLIYTKQSTLAFLDFLKIVEPNKAEELSDKLDDFAANRLHFYGASPTERQLEKWENELSPVVEDFEENEKQYSAKTSEEIYQIARQNLRILEQALAILKGYDRDEFQAENVKWIMNYEVPGAKAMIWAHNGHISCLSPGRLGYYLKNSMGDDYYSIGFEFAKGNVLVHKENEYISRQLSDPLPGSYGEKLCQLRKPMIFVDFSILPTNSSLRNTFQGPLLHRHIGVDYGNEADAYRKVSLIKSYDSIIFIENTNSAIWVNNNI